MNMMYLGHVSCRRSSWATRRVGGMAVAQIPDLKNWEVSANVGELDRGHLNPGQKVKVTVVALAGKAVHGAREEPGRHERAAVGPPFRDAASRWTKPGPNCGRA